MKTLQVVGTFFFKIAVLFFRQLTEEFSPELDLVSGRKTNLNHLLNFTYSRHRGHEKNRGHSSWNFDSHGYGRKKGSYKKSLYKKEQYLQAK